MALSLYGIYNHFLFDYKPNKNELPGGNAKSFDWSLLKNINIDKPWFISGGININNIGEILNNLIPYGIDISSGVEDHPGIKNSNKIIEMMNNNGLKVFEGYYKIGRKDGLWTYYKNGKKEIEQIYIDGDINGLWRKWYPNGKNEFEGIFKNWSWNGEFV